MAHPKHRTSPVTTKRSLESAGISDAQYLQIMHFMTDIKKSDYSYQKLKNYIDNFF